VYERAHTRQIAEISGLANQMPIIAFFLAFAGFASLGLPGLSGFVGEFLSLLGAWEATGLWNGFALLAGFGVLFGAAYILWLLRRTVFGQPSMAVADAGDAKALDWAVLVPLAALILAMGLYWDLLLKFVDPAATALAKVLGQ
ncbi:MAG: hypothetical protein FDZ75_09420, partial [Actinobacteria bacterium]